MCCKGIKVVTISLFSLKKKEDFSSSKKFCCLRDISNSIC